MNVSQAANDAKNTLDLLDMTVNVVTSAEEPKWVVTFKQTDEIYLVAEIIIDNGGVVASVLDFQGMDHKMKSKIMDVLLQYIDV
jgi:hypothetical protein